MIKSYKSRSLFENLKFSFGDAVKKNKWKLILSVLLAVAVIVFGVVIAVKTDLNDALKTLQDISIKNFQNGIVGSAGAFFARFFSLLFNVLLLVVFSFSGYMFPLAEILFAYRGYLFGVNFALIFVFYGFGSAISAIVVILPVQLVIMFVLIMFYLLLFQMNTDNKKYGYCGGNRVLFVVIVVLLLLLLDLVETLLLLLLNGKVILVI